MKKIFIVFLTFFACNDSGYGPCIHEILDPLIVIEEVIDTNTGFRINEIKISNVSVDEIQIKTSSLVNDVSFNCANFDSSLYCNIPCGFGSSEGNYKINISSIGYRDTTLIFNAEFENFSGGCPSSNSGSKIITFKMVKL